MALKANCEMNLFCFSSLLAYFLSPPITTNTLSAANRILHSLVCKNFFKINKLASQTILVMQLVCSLGHSSSKILPDVAATMFEANSSSDSWEVNKHRMISLTFLGKHTALKVTFNSLKSL